MTSSELEVLPSPAVSVTHWIPGEIAIIVHGTATVLDADSVELDKFYDASWWRPVREQGRGVYLRIEADRMFAWAGDTTKYPT